MKIYPHNFNPGSNSGPNKFTRQLFTHLLGSHDVRFTFDQKEADVEFCLIQQQAQKVKPMLLRLDGIYFNSDQKYWEQNKPIKFAYDNADAVVFQSEFNKLLIEIWFGEHKNGHVIHNAADTHLIEKVSTDFCDKILPKGVEVWSCASSWRPHKRLNENIRYFLEFAPADAILAVAGKGAASERLNHRFNERIKFLGELDYVSLLSLYKRSTTFIHLAYLDHCPNVVVDAQAAGCKIICSATGGTSEIVNNGKIINEPIWNFAPIKLYEPPEMNFENMIEVTTEMSEDRKPSIEKCAKKYYDIIRSIA